MQCEARVGGGERGRKGGGKESGKKECQGGRKEGGGMARIARVALREMVKRVGCNIVSAYVRTHICSMSSSRRALLVHDNTVTN